MSTTQTTTTPEDGNNIAEDQDQGEVGDIKNKHPDIHSQVSRKRDMFSSLLATAFVAVIIGIFKSVVINFFVTPGKFCLLVVYYLKSKVRVSIKFGYQSEDFMLPCLLISVSRVFLSSNPHSPQFPFFVNRV